ncbi:MAG: septal ring lytic transglycosylase RlpA family protein [Pseudomonadota bacterium]
MQNLADNLARFIAKIGALTVLALLAACTTPPPGAATVGKAPAPAIRTPPSAPEAAGSPQDPFAATVAAPALPADEVQQPAQLGGELPREFQRGHASWYGPGFQNRRTASGERFDMNALTAAHRTLPFGTLVRVRSLVNGREVDVRITDRGPYSRNRIIDLSRAAAEELGMLGLGFKQVVLFVPESTPVVEELPAPAASPRKPARRNSPAVTGKNRPAASR